MTNTGCKIPVKAKLTSLLLVCSLFYTCLTLGNGRLHPTHLFIVEKSVFDPVKSAVKQQRVAIAVDISKRFCRKMAEHMAMHNFDELNQMAIELNDKALQCCVFELRADYYSVNSGLNPKSTTYYQKAIDFAVENNMLLETGIYESKMAVYLFIFKKNVRACKYFLDGMETFRQIGFNNVPDFGMYCTQIGNFYYTLGDYENASPYLNESLKYPVPNTRVKINTINTLGLIDRNNKKYDEAVIHFNTALKLAQQSRDSAWIGIAMGNIGSVAFVQHQFARARPNIATDYRISLKYGENLNAAMALLRLVKISLDSNKLDQTAKQLDVAETLIDKLNDTLRIRINFYDLKALFFERTGNFAASIGYRKRMEVNKDKLVQINNIAAVERVKLTAEMANNQMQVDKLKTDAKLEAYRRNTVIAVLFLLIVISLLIYDQRLLKVKKDKELLLSEKKLIDEELKNAASELLFYTESIRQKNNLIEEFKTQVATLEVKFVSQADDEHLEKLMHEHIMTDENWDEFKSLFTKVHKGFFLSVRKAFPNLSNTDTRILSLMKLQMTNREMANMLGITVEGIKKSKQRLRKKMELNADDDLDRVVASF